MKKLLIVNKGILEPEALTLLGASTKRNDKSKIGQFGSGNKYALAYLLKNSFNVRIFSGENEISIGIVSKFFREKEFQILVINGKETSITLDFGYRWSLWQAIRELYSNAVDEGLIFFGMRGDNLSDDQSIKIGDEMLTGENLKEITTIEIEANPEIEDFFFNVRDYLGDWNEVLYENKFGKIYRKHNARTCIYFRGIRCYESNKESIFDYDFNDIEIGENRLIKYSWTLPQAIWSLLFDCDDKIIIRTLIQTIQNSKFIENLIDDSFVMIPDLIAKTAWEESLKGSTICPRDLGGYVKDEDRETTLMLPGRLYNTLIGNIGNGLKNKSITMSRGGTLFKQATPDPVQHATYVEAQQFLAECKYPDPLACQMRIVEFDAPGIMGSVSEEDGILISLKALDEGVQYTIATIIEEYLHIKTRAKDKTREFQTAIITEFINYMKLINVYRL